jgi:hypothetical protein
MIHKKANSYILNNTVELCYNDHGYMEFMNKNYLNLYNALVFNCYFTTKSLTVMTYHNVMVQTRPGQRPARVPYAARQAP